MRQALSSSQQRSTPRRLTTVSRARDTTSTRHASTSTHAGPRTLPSFLHPASNPEPCRHPCALPSALNPTSIPAPYLHLDKQGQTPVTSTLNTSLGASGINLLLLPPLGRPAPSPPPPSSLPTDTLGMRKRCAAHMLTLARRAVPCACAWQFQESGQCKVVPGAGLD